MDTVTKDPFLIFLQVDLRRAQRGKSATNFGELQCSGWTQLPGPPCILVSKRYLAVVGVWSFLQKELTEKFEQ